MTVLSPNWENLSLNVDKMVLSLCKGAKYLKCDLRIHLQKEFRGVDMKEFMPLHKRFEDLLTKKMSETSDTQSTIQTTPDSIQIGQFSAIIWKTLNSTKVLLRIWELREVTKTLLDWDIFHLTGIKNKIDQIPVSGLKDYHQRTWTWN